MANRVAEIMNRELFTVSEDESVGRIRTYMVALGIRAAPVVDGQGRPRGFVSLGDLQGVPPEHHVHVRMSAPAETISPTQSIEAAGRRMAARDHHHLVCVDDDGRVVGFIGALDVLRGLLGEPIRHPEVFPHRDERGNLRWSDEAWLTAEQIGAAPDGPGVLMLITGSPGSPDRVVWSEACWNVRGRLQDLLAGEENTPAHLRELLRAGALRFRAAVAPSSRALPSAASSPDSPAS
jgi:CBS domain-containing protein